MPLQESFEIDVIRIEVLVSPNPFSKRLVFTVLYRRVQNSDGVRVQCYSNDSDSALGGGI